MMTKAYFRSGAAVALSPSVTAGRGGELTLRHGGEFDRFAPHPAFPEVRNRFIALKVRGTARWAAAVLVGVKQR